MEGAGETTTSEGHLTSAAAFVEGGIQDACDDACSICLEVFCDSDPSTLTSCKHEYHLQCILEWCQRSSQCPMCWQSISLKDPTSQELLEAVEQERNFRFNPSRNATIFRHPTLGDFELQHRLKNGSFSTWLLLLLWDEQDMGQEGKATEAGHQVKRDESDTVTNLPLSPPNTLGEGSLRSNSQTPTSSQPRQVSPSASDSNSRSRNQASPSDQDRAGPSELQSFSESLKSRLNAVSTRYKESISKNTRNWKDRFFSRNTSMADISSEVKREVSAGIATVSRMMERLETRENSRPSTASVSNVSENETPESNSDRNNRSEAADEHSVNERGVKGTCAAGSGSGSS
ncbi:E3 ubiquitin-protein ligase RHF2A [Cardamine amara subsp. amara]|uniref:RING-type E3 ubiquitin transferase n=1 Tax=Cardamine amara subsp. amara TaxID=228776 RepID=A0ABD1AC28_CARAN